jgi:hypothetical protein
MILRVFVRRNKYTPDDRGAFIGFPLEDGDLINPHEAPMLGVVDEIRVSIVFSWDLVRGRQIASAWERFYLGRVPVKIGGPALRSPCKGFTPGMYVKAGITYTSRGCNQQCPWCQAWDIEGQHRLIENFEDGWIIADNDFLGCPWSHRLHVYDMLRRQTKPVAFTGGLRAGAMTLGDMEQIVNLRIAKSGLWFACDAPAELDHLAKVAAWLRPLYSREKLRCYMLAGYFKWDTPELANERATKVFCMGLQPFMQLCRAPDEICRRRWPNEWAIICKRWARPALSKAYMEMKGPIGTLSMASIRRERRGRISRNAGK